MHLSHLNSQELPLAAASYAILGIPVFPITPGQKSPPLVPWTEQATTDLERIAYWWNLWPDANIGLAMGDGWAALDLDEKEDRSGWQSYLALGGDPAVPWPVQHTPGGGRHMLWETEEVFGNFVDRGPRGGLDMRARHGYIVAAPSRTGGGVYQWEDGDPAVPIPAELLTLCHEASQRALERSLEGFPEVEPTPMTDEEVEQRVSALGTEHARFLRGQGGVTGDESKDAFRACCRAFSLGWSLEDMAAIGPRTYLAQFGAKPPHNATDPWRWCWRYTVRAAWTDKRKAADGAAAFKVVTEEVTLNEDSNGEEDTTDEGSGQEEGVSLYRLLELRSQRLPQGDYPALRQFLEELASSGLGAAACRSFFKPLKAITGQPVDVIRGTWEEIQQTRAQAHREEKTRETRESPEVYVKGQAKILDRTSGSLFTREAFLVEKARAFGGDKQAAEEHWLSGSTARCEIVEQVTYDPGLDPGVVTNNIGVRVYNLYRPSPLPPRGLGSADDVRPWLALLRALKLEGGEEVEEMLLDRLAWVVQRPGVKVNHGMLFGGDKGIGKDSFLAPVLDAVGRHNIKTIDGADLASDFNSYLAGTKVVVVNEIDFGDHKDRRLVSERLKRVLAAPPDTLTVNEKNLRPYEIPNRVQVIGMTNHRLCLHIEHNERRWLPIWCAAKITPQTREQWTTWFERYWDWLADGGSSRVLAFLRARDISHFRPGAKPPVTTWMEELMRASRDPVEIWLIELIESGHVMVEKGVVKLDDLISLARTGEGSVWLVGVKDLGERRMTRALHGIGAKPRMLGIRRHRYWELPSTGGRDGSPGARAGTLSYIRARKHLAGLPATDPDWL